MRLFYLALLSCLLPACSTPSVTDYSDFQPRFEPEQFFSGKLVAHGVVKDRSGRVMRTFSADIAADWEAGIGTLDEDFVFNNGEKDKRIWTLTPTGDKRFDATAGDVVGTGTMEASGNSVFLDYVLRIPYGDGSVDVRVDDRMYLVAPGVLLNESKMKKFGFEVGSILLVILQQAPGTSPLSGLDK
jgi:hypothetical protein